MKITLRAVRKGSHDYERVQKLYRRSFPLAERAPFQQLMHWADGRRAQMYALYDESAVCAEECGNGCGNRAEECGKGDNDSASKRGGGCAGGHDGKWIGLAYFVRYRDVLYLFYLAIDENSQGKGYGSALLAAVRRHFAGRRVILNIEEVTDTAPNYEERIKRKHFYEKNGFHEMGYTVKELGVVYEMLGMGETVTRKEYIALMRSLIGRFGAWYIYHGQEKA